MRRVPKRRSPRGALKTKECSLCGRVDGNIHHLQVVSLIWNCGEGRLKPIFQALCELEQRLPCGLVDHASTNVRGSLYVIGGTVYVVPLPKGSSRIFREEVLL
jgi:hypothetical protein